MTKTVETTKLNFVVDLNGMNAYWMHVRRTLDLQGKKDDQIDCKKAKTSVRDRKN